MRMFRECTALSSSVGVEDWERAELVNLSRNAGQLSKTLGRARLCGGSRSQSFEPWLFPLEFNEVRVPRR